MVTQNTAMGLEVIGAGFGRTGTASMKQALEMLGYEKCHHMVEVFENPGQAETFMNASKGGDVDWDAFFTGYKASMDFPSCAFYKELAEKYADAKVILTVRDAERWYESACETIYAASRKGPVTDRGVFSSMLNTIIWDGIFDGRFEDREYAIKVFNDHIAEVKRVVPAHRLLVFDVKQGWVPLCSFLGVPVPDMAFPRRNDRATFATVVKEHMEGNSGK